MENSVTVKARGKINLSLNIVGRRDGMHMLESVASSVDVFDIVNVAFCRGGINVKFEGSDGAPLKIPENNTVVKAMNFLREYCPDLGADIVVKKGIPIGGGLGGSSADAAAVIVAAAKVMPRIFGKSDVIQKSVKVGSDVPLMCLGGCVIMRGIGECVTKTDAPKLNIVIARAGSEVNSGAAYAGFDNIYPDFKFAPTDTAMLVHELRCGDLSGIARGVGNALTEPAIKLCPEIEKVLAELSECGALAAWMTGSGNCCCGLFGCESERDWAERKLNKSGIWAVSTVTACSGVSFVTD